MKNAVTLREVRHLAPVESRKPQVPVIYTEAVKALAECRTLDEAKYFDNKADALAAWAKIYHDDVAGRQAKALKLHAYARMGALARELRPAARYQKGVKGAQPGARALLMDSGLSGQAAKAAVALSQNPKMLAEEVSSSRPRAPTTVWIAATAGGKNGTPAWKEWSKPGNGARHNLRNILNFDSKLAAQMTPDEAKLVVAQVEKLQEWCDDFLRFAEKAIKKGKK